MRKDNQHIEPEPAGEDSAELSAHRAYVLAVCAELADQELEIRSVCVSPVGAAVRHAEIELALADCGGCVLVRWDELNGWSWQTRNDHEQPRLGFFGGLLPSPTDLVDWLVMSIWYAVVRSPRAGVPANVANLDARLLAYHR